MRSRLSSLFTSIILVFGVCQVAAWGNLGHRTVAYLAEKHLTHAGLVFVRSILGDVDISEAAIWADWYKDTPEGRYTGSWHFINGHDDPPTSCELDLARDCPGENGCIVTAIMNMTKQVGTNSISKMEKTAAFKFLIHLIGDLHQPLHTEALARGGNDIPVLFGGQVYNLHFLWDVIFPQTITSSNETNEVTAAKSWARKLYSSIAVQSLGENMQMPDYYSVDHKDGEVRTELARSMEPTFDVLGLAKETNSLVCEYVLKDGLNGVKGKELNGSYYAESMPVIEEQIARAGRTLGNIINVLAQEAATGKSQGRDIGSPPPLCSRI